MSVCFLIAHQRSGTSALGSIFNQHPELMYLTEIFHDRHIGHELNYFTFYLEKVRHNALLSLPGAREKVFRDYLDYIKCTSKDRTAIIDVKYNSVHNLNDYWQNPAGTPGLIRFLYKNDIPVIHLKRDNILKSLISTRIADLNNVWHTDDAGTIRTHRLLLDTQNLIANLTEMAEQSALIEKSLARVQYRISLTYEGLFGADGTITACARQSICDLLNLTTFPTLKPLYVKQTKDDLHQVIENYDDVKRCLSGSPFAWMLES